MHLTSFYLSGAVLLAALPVQASKIAKDLRGKSQGQLVNVIVQFRNTPRANGLEKIIRKGGLLKTHFAATKAAAYTVSAGQLEAIAADPKVAIFRRTGRSVQPSMLLPPPLAPTSS
jgi:hypothetical protein